LWNRNYIDHVQITAAESVDVGHRAGYYDHSGVLRDMFQNHILQLLTLTAMEAPTSFNATALRNEKVKVLHAIRPIAITDVVLGQYEGYRDEDRVAPDSRTPTYAAMRLFINNWRWQGVPFYLRSGKALPQKTSEISIFFRCPPFNMFGFDQNCELPANVLSIIIQPNEGIHLSFATKLPDSYQGTQAVNMNFYYSDTYGDEPLPDAYERLLLDALNNDASLFARADEIEQSWKIIDPVIRYAEDPEKPGPILYPRGSWGPKESLDLIAANGGCWQIMQGSAGICTI
jgi:glucose-6-phosphate 1-dehydrogenase